MNFLIIMPDYQSECFFKDGNLLNNLISFFEKCFSFLTVSSLFIAMTGFSLPLVSFLLYRKSVEFDLVLASFFITFAVYSINKLTDIKEDSINLLDRVEFTNKNWHYIIIAVILSSFAAFYISLLYSLFAIFIIFFPFCIGFVYSIKIANFRLKDIFCIKSISVALAWAVVGTFIPVIVHSSDFITISAIFYFFFVKFFIYTVLFDIRDIEADRLNNVITIPVFLGINKTKNLLLLLNSTFIVWLIFSYTFFYRYLIILIFSIAYGHWQILHFSRKGKKLGKSLDLLVEGEFIIIAIISSLFF
jgi:4-hydroxybenzoate polyprenyltransferase